jgi:hypothetical protein
MQIEVGDGGRSEMQIEAGQSEMRQLGLEKDEWGRSREAVAEPIEIFG